jgi:hypothetical protein
MFSAILFINFWNIQEAENSGDTTTKVEQVNGGRVYKLTQKT